MASGAQLTTTGSTPSLRAGNAQTIGTTGTNQVTTVTVTGGPSGGTFTITVGANTTAGQPFNETGANIQTAVTGLASVGASNASVARTGSGTIPDPYVYTITFKGTKACTALTVSASGASLTGGTSPAAAAALVTASAARAAGFVDTMGSREVCIQLNPSADCAGNVAVTGTIDGTNYGTLITAIATVASTPSLNWVIDKPVITVQVDATGLTAGQCPVYISTVKERHG